MKEYDNNASIADLRRDYKSRTLDIKDVSADPFTQFRQWFDEALKTVKPSAGVEANAMTLATATPEGKPAQVALCTSCTRLSLARIGATSTSRRTCHTYRRPHL